MTTRVSASLVSREKRNLIGVQSCQGREWIRIPSIMYAPALLTIVPVILGEEIAGIHATPHFPIVLLANLLWLLFPIYIIYRMWRYPAPFTIPYQAIEARVSQSFPEHTGITGEV